MTRSRDWAMVAALALVLAVTGRVWPDGRKESGPTAGPQLKVYALAELATRAGDPAIGDWLVKTLPQVIEQGSWATDGGTGTLNYYAQGKILIVSHDAGVQDKVRAFLDNLKSELPRQPKNTDKSSSIRPAIVPARLSAPDQDPTLPAPDPAFVPQIMNEPARHYGHLLLEGVSFMENEFKLKKFSIMYRGEGLIDDTLAKLIKSLNKQSATPPGKRGSGQPTPTLQEPTTPPPASSPSPDEDEPSISRQSPSLEHVPEPKKARRPAPTAMPAKSIVVQSRYAPAPRLAAPEHPMVQVVLPEEAKHYAHLVVEGLTYSEKGLNLKKLSVVYRGDGIIDSNVAKVIKAMQGNMPVFGMDGCTPNCSPVLTPPTASDGSASPTFVAPTRSGTKAPSATIPGKPNETNLQLKLIDVGDPVEVGKRITYELTVTNGGTEPVSDVEIKGIAPAELKLVAGKGPDSVTGTITGQVVTFTKLDTVEPGKSYVYTIKVKALKAGDVRFRAEMNSPSLSDGPIIERESTTIIDPERPIESSRESQPPSSRTQVRFTKPAGMSVSWYDANARGVAPANQVEAPGRFNFKQGAVYRLKVGNLKGRPGVEIYPTLEVVPSNPKTKDFLTSNAVEVKFSGEDVKQVADGNNVVRVIYLPRRNTAGAVAQPQEIVSTRLEPDTDPIAEAQRRGSILLVIRMGESEPASKQKSQTSSGSR